MPEFLPSDQQSLSSILNKDEHFTPEMQGLLCSDMEGNSCTNETRISPTIDSPNTAKKSPTFCLMQADGDISVVRVHFETSNDSLIMLKAAILISCLVVLVLFLYFVITQDVIPIIRNPTSFLIFLNFRTIVSFVMVIWFIAFCLLSHLVRVNFDMPSEGELFFADIRKESPKCNVCVLPGGEVSLLILDPEKSKLVAKNHSILGEPTKEMDEWSTRAVLIPDEENDAIELHEVESGRI
ncbi:hypothetical protein K7432_004235 [Basidiobolus ranarum]|uniref:Uncharacterized protein n=1 Tax=Basidiobolus ranarum TaxID=34480 RepID=A0ABR2WYK1_9FUNG